MKIRTPYSPLALFAWQRDDAPPKRIYQPRRGLNDISVLSKSYSLSRDKAVVWRNLAKLIRSAISKTTYGEPGLN